MRFVGTALCYGSGVLAGYGNWGDPRHFWLYWLGAVAVFMAGRWAVDES
jgi:hypothetical protein